MYVRPEDVGGDLLNEKCTKYPNHTDFIPAHRFSVAHVDRYLQGNLPYGLTKQDVVDLVKTWVPTTVRIIGNHISENRPDTWNGVYGSYPLTTQYHMSEHRGEQVRHAGSGWVRRVWETTVQGSSSRSWDIWVLTAQHVIFGRGETEAMRKGQEEDHSEAKACHITFFDDGVSAPVTLKDGGRYDCGDTKRDVCSLTFTTSDVCLGEKLVDLLKKRKAMTAYIEGKINMHKHDSHHVGEERKYPIVTIGYAHSKQCHITMGYLKDVMKKDDWRKTSVKYTAKSCAGSSGCVILSLGRLSRWDFLLCYPHSGASLDTQGAGESAARELWAS